MSGGVGAAARRRDVTAVLILVAGAAVAAYGYLGLHAMAAHPIERVRGQQAMARAIGYNRILYFGLGVMAVGIGAALWSAWRYHRSGNPHA